MNTVMLALHAVAGFVVLAEALNKLERCDPLGKHMTMHQRLVDGLKAVAWFLLGLGAAGALAVPALLRLGVPADAGGHLFRLEGPTLDQTLVLVGFAVLIVRTRVKEG